MDSNNFGSEKQFMSHSSMKSKFLKEHSLEISFRLFMNKSTLLIKKHEKFRVPSIESNVAIFNSLIKIVSIPFFSFDAFRTLLHKKVHLISNLS